MDFDQSYNQRTSFTRKIPRLLIAGLCIACCLTSANAQIRSKRPDRGTYQPPVVQRHTNSRRKPSSISSIKHKTVSPTVQQIQYTEPTTLAEMLDNEIVRLSPAPKPRAGSQVSAEIGPNAPPYLLGRKHVAKTSSEVIASDVMQGGQVIQGEVVHEDSVFPSPIIDEGNILHEGIIDSGMQGGCDGCSDMSCDSIGCDSMGCNSCSMLPRQNGFISFDRCDWFGSIDLMLMFRRGDRPPALLTTGPDGDADTAGELNQAGTEILVGGDSIFKDRTAGMRLELGTWLDNEQSRSLVLRGWFAGEKTFAFNRNQDTLPVIVRPFLNVSDGQTEAQDTQIVAFPNRATGSISIHGDSNVFGGDLSIRQLYWGQGGASVDVFYGYQFMRLDENLAIRSSSVSLDDDFAPLGSTIAIEDSFDIENEFHGGQLGVSSFYRWGCWSLSGLAKTGFGSLTRRANLRGTTTTSIDGLNATDPNGLLIRSTNGGDRSDSTFGWVPEIDLTLGWRKFPHFDATIGYHVIGMTDALQVSGAIDRELATNLAVPPTGSQRPSSGLRFDTFYIQGIHFGLRYVY